MRVFRQLMMKKIPIIYKELEWIQSDGNAYIDTGITANQDTIIKCRASINDSGTQVIIGSSTSGNLYGIGQQSTSNLLFAQYYTSTSQNRILSNIAGNDGIIRNFEFRKNEFYIDNVYIGDSTEKTFTANSLKLFTFNPSSSISKVTIYSVQIYNDTLAQINYIPVRRLADNVLGMYDTVSKTFFTNAGTGSFIGSDEILLTVVGSPTITDGVVSGFSSSDYIRTTNSFKFSQITNYEILIKCKGNGYPICLGQGGSGTWKIWVTTNGEIFFTTSAHSERISISGLSVDTEYYIRVKYNNSTAILGYSTDNINYTETSQNFTGLSTATSVINIGYNQNYGGFWNGSIDLNSSYIVINGTKYIFTLP